MKEDFTRKQTIWLGDDSQLKNVYSGRVMLVVDHYGYRQGVMWGGKGQELFKMEGTRWMACGDVSIMSTGEHSSDRSSVLMMMARRTLVNSQLPLKSRIIHALTEIEILEGPTFRVTGDELSLMCGCFRESATRTLKALDAEGHIQRRGMSVTIWQPSTLPAIDRVAA